LSEDCTGAGFAARDQVTWLTRENWEACRRTRKSAGIWMAVRIERAPTGYVGIYGFPPRFGSRFVFADLDRALEWANRDSGGVQIWVTDDATTGVVHELP
jgi:hypothetical protein